MGTNFYLRRKLSKEQKDEAINALQNDKYQTVRNILSEVEEIHIGKRSSGWKFLFNANGFQYFKPNKESFIEFLKTGQIINEYDEEFTFEEFWNEEIPNGEGLIDIGQYYKLNDISYKHREELNIVDRFKKEWNIDVNYWGEFYIDNLRFTTCSKFS